MRRLPAELPARIIALEQILTSDQGKQNNRANFPFASRVVDELREVFGDGVSVVWAEENGRTIGKKGPDGVRPNIEKRKDK